MGYLKEDVFVFKCRVGLQYDKNSEDPFCIWLYDDDGYPLSSPEATSGAIAPTLKMVTEMTGRNLAQAMSEALKHQE